MIFKGHGIVWDPERDKSLCEFVNGELDTEDDRVIDLLTSLGYESEGARDISVAELKAALDEKGISYKANAKKADLIKLLEGAE